MIKNVIEITDLKFGGKAYGLNKLNNLKVHVPTAYAIDQSSINSIISGDKDSVMELQNIIDQYNKNFKFAVRSSASNEDGKEKSYAGMYESVLNVPNNIDDVIKAIAVVNSSSASKRIESYNDEKINMNVVLQEMVEPKISGVCFTDSIDLNGDDSIYIEYKPYLLALNYYKSLYFRDIYNEKKESLKILLNDEEIESNSLNETVKEFSKLQKLFRMFFS